MSPRIHSQKHHQNPTRLGHIGSVGHKLEWERAKRKGFPAFRCRLRGGELATPSLGPAHCQGQQGFGASLNPLYPPEKCPTLWATSSILLDRDLHAKNQW
eukprot:scaffold24935_cov93-Cylindrotheca_fusiformis.AAC.1